MKAAIHTLLAGLTVGSTMSHAALISHWTFNESSGTIAADSAGAFNGTLSGGATFVPGGISGNAISLAEISNSLVNMGTSFPGFTAGDFSIMSWVNTISTDPDTIVFGKHEGGQFAGYFLGVNANNVYGAPNKGWFYATCTAGQGPTSTTSVNDGAWHQIVGVYTAGSVATIYVDGAPVEDFKAAQTMNANTAPFLIGGFSQSGSPTATYTGLVDDVQVYSNALSSGEVQFLFANPGQTVPEPASLMLLVGGAGMFLIARKRTRMA